MKSLKTITMGSEVSRNVFSVNTLNDDLVNGLF